MWITASSPSRNLGNGIRNTFATTITIVGGIGMTTAMNWKHKLVYCATNIDMSNCNGCCSTISNNGFLSVLIISDAAILGN
jgi:hypothetical protein